MSATIDTSLENILILEADNTTGRIHLHYCPENERWAAYEMSALNLIGLVPELKDELKERIFPDCEIRLRYIEVDAQQTELYRLPDYCTLIGDYYIELQNTPQ